METIASTDHPSLRVHVLVWCAAAIIVAALGAVCIVFQDANVWADWTPAAELHQGQYAETIHPDSILRTRVNTWSNVAFLFVGLYVIALGLADRRAGSRHNFLTSNPAFSFLYGAACIGLATGSAFFHASLTRWGQHVDVAMIYAPPLLLIAMNVARHMGETQLLRVRSLEISIATGIGLWLILFWFKWSLSSTAVVVGLAATLLLFAVLDHRNPRFETRFRYMGLATLALSAGVFFQALDAARVLAVGDGLFQGHSLWHVCGALALWWAYRYYRSERAALDLDGAVADPMSPEPVPEPG